MSWSARLFRGSDASAYASLALRVDEPLLAGRRHKHALTLTDPRVSADHCSLRLDDTSAAPMVTDTSSNGTFLNGKRLPKNQPTRLAAGDVLSLVVPTREAPSDMAAEKRSDLVGVIVIEPPTCGSPLPASPATTVMATPPQPWSACATPQAQQTSAAETPVSGYASYSAQAFEMVGDDDHHPRASPARSLRSSPILALELVPDAVSDTSPDEPSTSSAAAAAASASAASTADGGWRTTKRKSLSLESAQPARAIVGTRAAGVRARAKAPRSSSTSGRAPSGDCSAACSSANTPIRARPSGEIEGMEVREGGGGKVCRRPPAALTRTSLADIFCVLREGA